MGGKVRLFDKTDTGLLVEIEPDKADELRASRRVSHMNIGIDVLWTAKEQAARDAEIAMLAEQAKQVQQNAVDEEERRNEIAKRIGLSVDELRILAKT
jgi:hypothetical protein